MNANEDCARFDEDLPAFLDGELGRKDSAAMAAHLAGCARCGAEVRAAARAWEVFQNAHREAPLPRELRENPYRARRLEVLGGFGWGYAAALAALCAALYLGARAGRGPEPAVAGHRRFPPIDGRGLDLDAQDVGLNPAPYLGHIPT